jgi:hypothetical protein
MQLWYGEGSRKELRKSYGILKESLRDTLRRPHLALNGGCDVAALHVISMYSSGG